MAKKPTLLTFRDIVLGAEADVIRQALEARLQIDQLIAERQAAYERIAVLETQVEDIIGEAGSFPFPPPPMPVAGFDPKAELVSRPTSTPTAAPTGRRGRPPGSGAAAAQASGSSNSVPATEADDDSDDRDEQGPA